MVRRKKSIFNSEKKHRIVFDECLDLSKIICSYCLIKYVEVFHVIGKIFKKVFWSSHVKFGDNFYIYGSDKDPFQISRIDNCELKESEKLNLSKKFCERRLLTKRLLKNQKFINF